MPLLTWMALGVLEPSGAGGWETLLLFAALIGAVFATVHHAEAIAPRCLVPFTSFSENEALADGSFPPVWLAADERAAAAAPQFL